MPCVRAEHCALDETVTLQLRSYRQVLCTRMCQRAVFFGFIVRDDTRQEIVVSFPGTNNLADVITDMKFRRVPFISPGIPLDMAIRLSVHRGFLAAYNVVAQTVLDTVKAELAEHPAYTIAVTGHSLGGAIASLAAPALKSELPAAAIKLFTFGQPRVGNRKFAAFVEKKLGVDNIFRSASFDIHSYPYSPAQLDAVSFDSESLNNTESNIVSYTHHSQGNFQAPLGLFYSPTEPLSLGLGTSGIGRALGR
ncbi:Alpha/Beta hydrolase protein [Mycena leptocephala]|nr:Alpha/Beta hydrolase protein [Mycena leptocephala]KAJ7939351.1 Alpha/Beta hydrolase protein [Mycena leptocephala]